jgi:hypothetical protein
MMVKTTTSMLCMLNISPAEHLSAVKVIQRWSHLQVIHTKGTISSLRYRSTNCDSNGYLYGMKVTMTTTNATVTGIGWTLFVNQFNSPLNFNGFSDCTQHNIT